MDQLSGTSSPLSAEESPASPQNNARPIIGYIVFAALIIFTIAAILYYFLVYRYYQSTDNAYIKADLTWIVPRVSGEVVELKVTDNQTVEKGQLLMVLDDRDLQARYEQSQAIVAMKESSFNVQQQNERAAQASISQAKSNVNATQAELKRLSAEHQRYQQLLKDGVITRQKFESIQSQYASAQAQYDNAQAAVHAAEAQAASISASRGQMQADLNSAKAVVKLNDVDRQSSQVIAPVSGTVGSLAVRHGSRVSSQTRVLAIIPKNSIYVEANFKETQIEKMRIGQKVSLVLDAYPNEAFVGHIQSFSPASGATFSMMPPDNATGNFNKVVQRVPVRIAIEPHPHIDKVKPGLSVVTKVDIRG